MRLIEADLHIHSALSPCADDEMTPELIVYAAIARELDVIAICDHNCAGNVLAVQEAAREIAGDFLCVIAGMEITTAEEAHIIALFPGADQAMKASDELALHLPHAGPGGNPLGPQHLMDSKGNIVGTVDRLLSFASQFSVSETAAFIRSYDGLVIAAHVNRPTYSIVSQLGFMPDDVVFDAVEIQAFGCAREQIQSLDFSGSAVITASDAHYIQNIGDARIRLLVDHPDFYEVKAALRGERGRECHIA